MCDTVIENRRYPIRHIGIPTDDIDRSFLFLHASRAILRPSSTY